MPEAIPEVPVKRGGNGFGKPSFPNHLSLHTKLADLAGPDSWFAFRLLKLDAGFLELDVKDWPDSPAYQSSKANVMALNVTNDAAERRVKMGCDYLEAARSETHFQSILQVVEQSRKTKPDLRVRLRKRRHE